jgi:hypothetical protein
MEGARGLQENYRAEHQGDGRDQFAHQALGPPWKCFFIDMNITAAQLCFQLHVHFRYSVTRSCEQLLIIFGTVSTNYEMLCVLVSNQFYAHLNIISNRIWIFWPLYIICKFKLNYYLQFCDHCDPIPVTKLISNLWRIDVIFVTKVMANLWPFQKVMMANIILWWYKLVFSDDSKKDDINCHIIDCVKAASAATSLLTSVPCQMQTPLRD